jgi:alpha-tubulin suppressor-like RCC1 family protein
MRATIAAAAAVITALAGFVGCASSDDEPSSTPDVDAGPAPTPDSGPAPADDAGGDAGADAAPKINDPKLEPVVCAKEPCVLEIVGSSGLHACARRSDGKVGCWGDGNSGQLGADRFAPIPDGGAPFGTVATVVADLPAAVEIAIGGTGYTSNDTGPGGMNGNSCARTNDGDVYCWGQNGNAFTGVTRTNTHTPVKMPFPPAKHVALGNGIICVLDAAGVPTCSGTSENNRDYLVPSNADTTGPRTVITGGGACVRLVGSARNVFCIEASGKVSSWGFGRSLFPNELAGDIEPSIIGRLSSLEKAPPSLIPTLSGVTSLNAPWSTACAISNGEVHCWGRSDFGQNGTGGRLFQYEPQPVGVAPRDHYVKQVATGYNVSCAVSDEGKVYCWGDNSRGQLARTGVPQSMDPVEVEGLPQMVQIAVLQASVCALSKAGEVWCWGDNGRGQLGRGVADGEAHADPMAITWATAQ